MTMDNPVAANPAKEAAVLAQVAEIPGATVGWVTAEDWGVGEAGVRALGGDAVQDGDLWHIGSVTKSMTATLAARLVDAGAIEWDSTIGDVLGASFPGMHADWRNVTLEALLRHASGMQANIGLLTALRVRSHPREAYVARVLPRARVGDRGGFLYSNAGYVVAGAMLEATGGASWEDLMQSHVFQPLGIESAGFGPPQGAAPQGHRPRLGKGVRPIGQGQRADNIPAIGPAGRVHLSTGGMLRYLRAHLVRDTAFLSADCWTRLHTRTGPGGYALGWLVAGEVLVHNGSNSFWYALARVNHETGVAGFVAVNSGHFQHIEFPVIDALNRVMDAAR